MKARKALRGLRSEIVLSGALFFIVYLRLPLRVLWRCPETVFRKFRVDWDASVPLLVLGRAIREGRSTSKRRGNEEESRT